MLSSLRLLEACPAPYGLLMIVGNENRRRVHGCLVHIDIVGDKIWIQADGTERGMAPTLARGGIAPERILLAISSGSA